MITMSITVDRDDELPAFAAFLRCEPFDPDHVRLVLNVQATMCPEPEDGVSLSREERKRYVISHLMHEFGHALEAHFKLPVNEDAIEKAVHDWEKVWYDALAEEEQA